MLKGKHEQCDRHPIEVMRHSSIKNVWRYSTNNHVEASIRYIVYAKSQ